MVRVADEELIVRFMAYGAPHIRKCFGSWVARWRGHACYADSPSKALHLVMQSAITTARRHSKDPAIRDPQFPMV